MYLRIKRFCAGSEDNRMRASSVSKVCGDRDSGVGLAEAKERMVRENRGYELMSLDLTGEPFPQEPKPKKLMPPRTMLCDNGHIDIWYDSTDSERCPLCAVREQRE